MKISAKQALRAYQESFENGDSSPLAAILSDDFVFTNTYDKRMTKDETLEWAADTDIRISDCKTLFESEEILVGLHSVSEPGKPSSQVMFFAEVKGYGKIGSWRVNRAFEVN